MVHWLSYVTGVNGLIPVVYEPHKRHTVKIVVSIKRTKGDLIFNWVSLIQTINGLMNITLAIQSYKEYV